MDEERSAKVFRQKRNLKHELEAKTKYFDN